MSKIGPTICIELLWCRIASACPVYVRVPPILVLSAICMHSGDSKMRHAFAKILCPSIIPGQCALADCMTFFKTVDETLRTISDHFDMYVSIIMVCAVELFKLIGPPWDKWSSFTSASLNSFYELLPWTLHVKSVSGARHRTPLMTLLI